MPPPPPPPPDESGWDYFDPADESFRFPEQNGNLGMDNARMYGNSGEKEFDFNRSNGVHEHEGSMTPKLESPSSGNGKLTAEKTENIQQRVDSEVKDTATRNEISGSRVKTAGKASAGQSNLRTNKSMIENDVCAEREDPSEFITHRAKDFLSSIKDIDSRFFRASESRREVSRMLEANKIHVGYGVARGASSASLYLTSLGAGCCQGRTANISDDQIVTKVITWKRTTSSKSSSSRNPLAMKDDDDSGSEYIDEFCMISGSHSSTLDRLYAWERKLYDEVKVQCGLMTGFWAPRHM